MSEMLRVADVMTLSPFSVDVESRLLDAQKLMAEKGIRHLPVTENNRPVSMLSERDIHLAVAANNGMSTPDQLSVGEVCTLHTYMVGPYSDLAEVTAYMGEHQLGSVIVVDNEELVGIFTATDACKLLANVLKK